MKNKHKLARSRKRAKNEGWRHRERYQGLRKNQRKRSDPIPDGVLQNWEPKKGSEHDRSI